MHERFLTQLLDGWGVVGHRTRAAALVRVVGSLLMGAKLALTQLGRGLRGPSRVKHEIKLVDRLLGNHRLHAERLGIYRALAAALLSGIDRPVIVVDWADFELNRKWLMLKAAVPLGGRAFSVYERVFPFKQYNSPGAHRQFLRELHAVLPDGCRPIVVTDAGFRGPWFRDVESHGWDWVGRVRNKLKYFREETGRWCFTHSLYAAATPTPKYVGEVTLSRRHQYRFHLYLVRAHQLRVGRHRKRGPDKGNGTLYRRLHRAPWLLATSLPHTAKSARQVKRLYAERMQIEETFRDLKSHRYGFGLRYARSGDPRRLEILLLIAALASLVVWLLGLAGRALELDRGLQANTVRTRAVLSVFFIGRQLVHHDEQQIPRAAFFDALRALKARFVPLHST